jgi:hypothetical protein
MSTKKCKGGKIYNPKTNRCIARRHIVQGRSGSYYYVTKTGNYVYVNEQTANLHGVKTHVSRKTRRKTPTKGKRSRNRDLKYNAMIKKIADKLRMKENDVDTAMSDHSDLPKEDAARLVLKHVKHSKCRKSFRKIDNGEKMDFLRFFNSDTCQDVEDYMYKF